MDVNRLVVYCVLTTVLLCDVISTAPAGIDKITSQQLSISYNDVGYNTNPVHKMFKREPLPPAYVPGGDSRRLRMLRMCLQQQEMRRLTPTCIEFLCANDLSTSVCDDVIIVVNE